MNWQDDTVQANRLKAYFPSLHRSRQSPPSLDSARSAYLFGVLEADVPGLSDVIVPLPNGLVALRDPSERVVAVPEPNRRVVPFTVLPPLFRSVVIEPLPKGRVMVVVPFDQRVMAPAPNRCVVPVMVFPFLSRSVVMEPLPKGRVVLRDPSERLVALMRTLSTAVVIAAAAWFRSDVVSQRQADALSGYRLPV